MLEKALASVSPFHQSRQFVMPPHLPYRLPDTGPSNLRPPFSCSWSMSSSLTWNVTASINTYLMRLCAWGYNIERVQLHFSFDESFFVARFHSGDRHSRARNGWEEFVMLRYCLFTVDSLHKTTIDTITPSYKSWLLIWIGATNALEQKRVNSA